MERACFGDWEAWFTCFGVPVRAQANNVALRRRIGSVMPPHSAAIRDGSGSRGSSIRVGLRGAGECACGEHHEHAVWFEDDIEHFGGGTDDTLVASVRGHVKLAVAERAPRHAFVHAGAVVVDDRAIVLPGRSLSGKTTLVRALVERGAAYLSDDYAAVDELGRVHAFAQPLGVRTPGSIAQRDVDPAEIGAVASSPVSIGLVVVTRHVAGTEFEPEAIGRAAAGGDLMAHAVAGRSAPGRVLEYLTRAVAAASAWRGPRGDAGDAADVILSLAGRAGPVR